MQPFFSITIYGAMTIGLFALSFFGSRMVRDFGIQQGIYAVSSSGGKVALWGGPAFMLPLALYAPFFLGLPTEQAGLSFGKAAIFFLAVLSFILFGLLDDLLKLSPLPQVLMQAVVALSLLFALFVSWESSLWILPLALFIFSLASMNAMNWTDGLDGLAVMTFCAALAPIAGLLVFQKEYLLAGFVVAFLASLAGFLAHNFAPAKLYMGTAGSMGLGLFAAALAAVHPVLLGTLLCALALPLGDAASVSLQRIVAGVSPWQGGDRRHLHYRLVDAKISLRAILLLYAGATLLFSLVGIVMTLAQAAAVVFFAPVLLIVATSWRTHVTLQGESMRAETLA